MSAKRSMTSASPIVGRETIGSKLSCRLCAASYRRALGELPGYNSAETGELYQVS